MRQLAWLPAVAAAFLAGVWVGAGLDDAAAPESPAGADALAVRPAAAPADGERSGAARAGHVGDWDARLARLDALVRGGDRAAAETLRAALLDEVLTLARAGSADLARRRLEGYLAGNPHDADAHLLDADLRQMRGDTVSAVDPLLALLGFADAAPVVDEARRRLDLLLNVRESQLAARGDLAGLIRLLERVSRGDPGYDGHRLRLARWQLRAGRVDAAAATLAETGTAGVDPAAREDLAVAVALARDGLPLERRPGADGGTAALHVRATAAGRALRLLVDTGATTTVISRERAADLGSMATGRVVPVRTAGGRVEAEIHVLRQVEIGPLRLDALEVLVLDRALPSGVDGLLGMDVLGRLPNQGLGGAAGS